MDFINAHLLLMILHYHYKKEGILKNFYKVLYKYQLKNEKSKSKGSMIPLPEICICYF